jgi:parallel beta-helix repeat protein
MRGIKAGTRLVQLLLAATIVSTTVNARTIYVDRNAWGATDGTSWADAYRSLQEALSAASGGDEIRVAQGTYRPDQRRGLPEGDRDATFRLINEVTIKGGYAGVTRPVPDARNISLFETILSGDLDGDDGPDFANRDDNSYHVVTGSGTNSTAVLDGFTIRSGNAAGGLSDQCGGGMYNDGSSPTLDSCRFEDNRADDYGGGMYNGSGSSPTLEDCTFSGNAATLAGGGMRNKNGSSPTLEGCTFSGNSAQYGGGMQNYKDCCPMLTDCAFTNNQAGLYGGGMSNYSDCNPTLTHCTFTGNQVDGYGSAGMHNDENCNCILTDCTFRNNSARAWGGGFGNYSSNATLTDCAFINNSAGDGAGGMDNGHGGQPVLRGCTFRGNSGGSGGAFRDEAGATLYNCLLTDNFADYGGGMYFDNGESTLVNCTLAGNAATNGNAFGFDSFDHSRPSSIGIISSIIWNGGDEFWNNDGSTISITYSDVYGGWTGEGNIFGDPLFIKSSDDYHLSSDSPCIDAGDPNSDYSNEPQPNGSRVNMGRYGNTPEASSKAEPQMVIVPNVVGMTKSNAATEIIAASLAVGSETSEHSETVPKRYVISQDPAAGTEVASGSHVNLVISLGPPSGKATLTVSSSAGGSVSTPGEGAFEYDQGSTVTIQAVAESDYRFVSWTGTAVDAGKVGNPQGTPTLRAQWKMGAGALTADSIGNNTLTNHGVTAEVGDYATTDGGASSGTFVAADGDYMDIADEDLDAAFPLKDGDTVKHIGLCLWFKPASLPSGGGQMQLAGKENSFDLYIQNGCIRLHIQLTDPGSQSWLYGPAISETDRWYHVGMTFRNSDHKWRLRMWDDTAGTVSETGGTIGHDIGDHATPFTLGSYKSGGDYFDGLMDDVRVYSDFLTSSEIDGIRGSSSSSSANTTVTVDADYTLKANFVEDIPKATLLLMSTVGGSVSLPGEGSFQYDPGSTVPIEATAEPHHYFTGWAGTAVDAGKVADPNAASTTVNVDSDYTLRAQFALDQDEVLLTISSTEGGTVVSPGEGDFTYDRGSTVSVAALSQAGSGFIDWTGSAVDAGNVADPNEASTTVFVDSDYTLRANFHIDPVELIISSTTGGSVTTPGEGSFLYVSGTTVSIKAVAQTDQSFVGWSGTAVDAGMVANPAAAETSVILNGDYTLQANFTPTQNKVRLATSSTLGGQVLVPGEGIFRYPPGSVVSIEALADPDYVFAGWTGMAAEAGKVADRRAAKTTVTMDTDYTLSANFAPPTKVVYVDANAPGRNDGSCWAHAFVHLQDALEVVEPGDEIHVAEGTYRPDEGRGYRSGDREATFRLLNDVSIKGGYAGYGAADPNAWDISEYETILSGDLDGDDGPAFTKMSDNSYHVVTCSRTDASAILDGFTITAGNADRTCAEECGGGVHNENGSPTLRNCMIRQNRAHSHGGGLYNDSESNPTLTNCTFRTNEADYGGGMANRNSRGPTLVDCTFTGNRATWYGGGMYNDCQSKPTLTNCTFTGNSANFWNGGALHSSGNSTTKLTGCTFSHNNAGSWGGALGNHDSNAIATYCNFVANQAHDGAGAMANSHDANSVFINCTFIGNSAGRGGAIQNRAALILMNCRISGNQARQYGGGICSRDESAQTLVNCTLSGNLAPDGSGIACFSYEPTDQSEVDITNSILWDLGPEIWSNNSSVIFAGYSNIQGGWPGPGQLDNDPCFVETGYWDPNGTDEDLTDDFWVDGDYHLAADSPCIDAANNVAVLPDVTDIDADGDTEERIPADLDGGPRFVDDPLTADTGIADPPQYPDVVDMGAYEFLGTWHTITPSAGDNGSIVPPDPVTVVSGGQQQFTAQPDTNYHTQTWYVDDDVAQTGGDTYVLSDIEADHTVHVTFRFNEPTIQLPDPNLQAAVEEELGTSEPTVSQMGALAYLDACDMGVNDLTGLQFAELLTVLLLDNNQLTNISVLQYLPRLTTLSLYNNNISDIAPLGELQNLEYLDVRANPLNENALSFYIPQITANNPGLILLFDAQLQPHTLTVSSTTGGSVVSPGEGPFQYDHGSEVTITATAETGADFAAWTGTAVDAGMVADPNAASTTVTIEADYTLQANFAHDGVYFADSNLKAAVEAELGTSNPTPADMMQLTKLQVYNKGIVDLTGLEYATQMHTLYLDGNSIADISTLLNLKSLRFVSLLNNNISDISALAGHKQLRLLNLRGNPLNIEAYTTYIPQIKANNPGVRIFTDRR